MHTGPPGRTDRSTIANIACSYHALFGFLHTGILVRHLVVYSPRPALKVSVGRNVLLPCLLAACVVAAPFVKELDGWALLGRYSLARVAGPAKAPCTIDLMLERVLVRLQE